MGVSSFGLLLDDIPVELQHADDRATFADLVDAQVALIGRVFERLTPDRQLIVCPTVYYGCGDEDYLARLGRAIDPRIDLFWSGRQICSPTLDLPDAATFARTTGRPATYWDNYPVNDVAMNWELHIGPYRGRDPHLYRFAQGRHRQRDGAVRGVEDRVRHDRRLPRSHPRPTTPRRAGSEPSREVVGDDDADAFALFADNVRSSCLSDLTTRRS